MKKFIGFVLAVMMCFMFAIPAMAQDAAEDNGKVIDIAPVDILVPVPEAIDLSVEKEITISEDLHNYAQMDMIGYFDKMKYITIDTFKHINIDFTNEIIVNSDGEAEVFGYQLNTENIFLDFGVTKTDQTVTKSSDVVKNPDVDPSLDGENGRWDRYTTLTSEKTENTTTFVPNQRTALIDPSVNDNNGFIGVNQSPGNLNNQANASAAAVIAGDEQLIEANGFSVQASLFNFLWSDQSLNTDIIADSINGNSGVVGVNQSSGNMNNQFNSAALAAGLNSDTTGALGEVTLKQVSADNLLVHYAVVRSDTITGSINNNSGIVSVNQASGDMVNQANVHAIAAKLE